MNFLSLLRAGRQDYVLNPEVTKDGALEYMARPSLPQDKLPHAKRKLLEEGKSLAGKQDWEAYLQERGITGPKHIER